MREIKYATRFKSDYRREKSGRHGKKLDALLMEVVNLLAADTPLPRRNFDHPLSGDWNDHRDCHIKPDLILLYRKPDDDILELCALVHIVSLGCEAVGAHPSSWILWQRRPRRPVTPGAEVIKAHSRI